MELLIAKTSGFCMGVDMALRKLDSAIKKNSSQSRIFTLGPIIHNPQVLEHYEKIGVHQTNDIQSLSSSDVVIIRAHGIPSYIQTSLVQQGVSIIDATCPKVKKAQILIRQQADQGKHLLLFGERDHPEVKGLISYADEYTVFETENELHSISLSHNKKYFFAAQTTQDRETFAIITSHLKELLQSDIDVLDTICSATKERQDEVRHLAQQVEAIVIAGGKNSGNTRRLFQIAEESGVYAVLVETAHELPLLDLSRFSRIGLTAGASTPGWIIDEIAATLQNQC